MSHPTQPLQYDDKGVLRFKPNAIVQYILDKGGLATKTKLRFSLLSQMLACERLPDNRERQLILDTVENWGVK